MSLTVEEIKKIAELSRLKLTSDEEKRYAETISAVLDYMTILNEVDTSGVEPTSQVTGLEDVFREDVPVDSKIKNDLIKLFPEEKDSELLVHEVFGDSNEDA